MRRASFPSRRTSIPIWSAAGLLVASVAIAAPVTWPADGDWFELTGGGSTDPIGDGNGSRDIVGDANDPVAQITRDATHYFLRIRVSEDPLQSATNFRPFGWVCYFETDGDPTSFEYKVSLDGVANPDELILEQNTVQGTQDSFNDPPEVTLSTVIDPLLAGHARSVDAPTNFGGTPDFYIDLALELSELVASGFDPTAPLRVTCGSSNNGGTAIADSTAPTLSGSFSDPVDCDANGCAPTGDTDGDGVDDGTETTLGLDPADADTDDDGVLDGAEPGFDQDSDGDGTINAADRDSDNDGLLDGTELGVDCMDSADTVLAQCIPDADAGATFTDPTDADSDNGTVSDGAEDANLNGQVDGDETDPTAGNGGDDLGNLDPDGDGLSTGEEEFLLTDPNDADSDDDGVRDGDEVNLTDDTDADGAINALDPDSDNDGLWDGTEQGLGCPNPPTDPAPGTCIADADPATRTNPLVADTDQGGVSDGEEDTDRDGRVDQGERDPNDPTDDLPCDADDDCGIDDDGLVCDTIESLCVDGCRNLVGSGCAAGFTCNVDDGTLGVCILDTDQDGLGDAEEGVIGTDPFDADSDDDGVIDGDEPDFDQDTDGDGLINARDPDSDDDGLFDGTELGVDCLGSADSDPARCRPDGDNGATVTDPLRADSDDGGVSDGSEDFDLDGVFDVADGETDPTLGNGADDAGVVDTDLDGLSDGLEDFLGSDSDDQDSDEDGVLDGDEQNPTDDTDDDGDRNVNDADSDGDGLFDGTERGFGCENEATDAAANSCVADADSTTTTSALDPDTDRGGIADGVEDDNQNGAIDDGERDPNDGTDDIACDADGDCGGDDDGLVCDLDAAECVEGCKGGVDGAGCPDGQLCSTDDDTLGICQDGAGGAGGQGGAGTGGQGGGTGGQGGGTGGEGQGGDTTSAGGEGPGGPGAVVTATSSGAGPVTTSAAAGGGEGGNDLDGIIASGGACTVSAPGAGRDAGLALAMAALGLLGMRRRRGI